MKVKKGKGSTENEFVVVKSVAEDMDNQQSQQDLSKTGRNAQGVKGNGTAQRVSVKPLPGCKTKDVESKGKVITVPGKIKRGKGKSKLKCRATQKVLDLWKCETEFIDSVFALLPNMGEVDEDLDEYLLDLSDSEENMKRANFLKKTQEMVEGNVQAESEDLPDDKDHVSASGDPNLPPNKSIPTHKPTRDELLERLHAKMALVAQQKNPNKIKTKKKKTDGKKGVRTESTKQFISKTNPNLKPTIKSHAKSDLNTVVDAQKTPLRTAPVKKSNGQVVYSKFDFITPSKTTTEVTKPKPKTNVTDILKKVERTEGKIARLESQGKATEAVLLSENQKWMMALQRADGHKVRDDPHLLKKSIKKEKKLKEARKKKWTQRVETVEKAKEARVKKRTANIQDRKVEKKKKQKKLQRKKGRII